MRSLSLILILSIIWTVIFVAFGVFSGWLTITVDIPWLIHPFSFMYRHLRLSIVPFGMLFLYYIYLVFRIKFLLNEKTTRISTLSYYNRLLNTTISLFFGVGVIWTAIGMETALMNALTSNTGASGHEQMSAWELLNRLVNGGLLLALSTTVFGGICGYLLRLFKIILIGEGWDSFMLGDSR